MNVVQKQGGRRLSVTVGLLLLGIYYLAVFRPLMQRERDQATPFRAIQQQLDVVATNHPAGSSLETLDLVERDARTALTNLARARALLAGRFQPVPDIATNLTRLFQLSDYQNERLNRGDRLIGLAAERKVKLLPAVTAGLPEFTIENPRPALLWGQLALVDGVLRASVEAGVASIESVFMGEPVNHPAGPGGREQFVELPLRIELTGEYAALTRMLGTVLNDAPARAELKLPVIDGLPVAMLHRILVVKETVETPGRIRLIAELSGFLRLPVAYADELLPGNN